MNEPLYAISLTQPWASLIALGEKQWETRSWRTQRRGLIAIAASKDFPDGIWDGLCQEWPYKDVLDLRGLRKKADFPTGAIVALATITDCQAVEKINGEGYITENEFFFGNYMPGRYAFKMENVFKLPNPVPCKGALSFWRVPTDVAADVMKQYQLAAV